MRHKTIEETFRAITPKRSTGSSAQSASPIVIDNSGAGSSFSSTFSQAGQEIAKLQAAFSAQSDALKSNTQAILKGSDSSQGGSSGIGDFAKSLAKNVVGGGGIASAFPLFSAIAGLFGGGNEEPPPLMAYQLPASVQIESTISNLSSLATAGSGSLGSGSSSPQSSSAESVSQGPLESKNSQMNFSPTVNVNIQAMDSQSFMDRSSDIADAVRAAVLNLHPINSVLAEL